MESICRYSEKEAVDEKITSEEEAIQVHYLLKNAETAEAQTSMPIHAGNQPEIHR